MLSDGSVVPCSVTPTGYPIYAAAAAAAAAALPSSSPTTPAQAATHNGYPHIPDPQAMAAQLASLQTMVTQLTMELQQAKMTTHASALPSSNAS